jgi:predicted RNase H-like HicB family nuclease
MTNRYLVVYAKTATNFSGMAPDVDGCVSSGQTLEEMRAMLKEGLTFHLQGTAADGDPIPVPHTTQINFADDDFEGVEYFVVEHLDIPVPAVINSVQRIPSHETASVGAGH